MSYFTYKVIFNILFYLGFAISFAIIAVSYKYIEMKIRIKHHAKLMLDNDTTS